MITSRKITAFIVYGVMIIILALSFVIPDISNRWPITAPLLIIQLFTIVYYIKINISGKKHNLRIDNPEKKEI